MNIPIVEKFVSLQGEGKYAGITTVFVRVMGCNLSCYYCDTKYANDYNKENYTLETAERLYNWISSKNITHICFTGGEPLQRLGIISVISKLLSNTDSIITIETNGTISLEYVGQLIPLEQLHIVMDFKMPELLDEAQANITTANLSYLTGDHEVKFVVDYNHLDWAFNVIKTYQLNNAIISPLITEKDKGKWYPKHFAEKMIDNYKLVKNTKFQLQLHKLIWGQDARGV